MGKDFIDIGFGSQTLGLVFFQEKIDQILSLR